MPKMACFRTECKSGKKFLGCTAQSNIEEMMAKYEDTYKNCYTSCESCTHKIIERDIEVIEIHTEPTGISNKHGIMNIRATR